jgi:hypothetical protein
LLIWSLRQTRQAISNDREIGHSQVRAYLTVEECGAWLIEGDGIAVTVSIKNRGQSPARSVHFAVAVPCNIITGGKRVSKGIFYLPSHFMGDISSGEIELSGVINYHNIELPEGIARYDDGKIFVLTGTVAVFAADVFDREIFETRTIAILKGKTEWDRFRERHSRNKRLPGIPGLTDIEALRSRGWDQFVLFEGGRAPKRDKRRDRG